MLAGTVLRHSHPAPLVLVYFYVKLLRPLLPAFERGNLTVASLGSMRAVLPHCFDTKGRTGELWISFPN